MEDITKRKNQLYQDQITQVFVENIDGEWLLGTNSEFKRVRIKSQGIDIKPGSIVSAKITKPLTWILEGEIVPSAE